MSADERPDLEDLRRMDRRWVGAIAVASVILAVGVGIAGCGSRGTPGESSTASLPSEQPYKLLTHCGVEFAMFADRWWRTETPLPEPAPLPGATYYDGLTAGTMRWISADRIRFESTDGRLKVEFVPYATQPSMCD